MVADFQNVYRYSVCLCSSVALADVLEHNCNPTVEEQLSFVVCSCVFFYLNDSGFHLSYIVGKKCGCLLLVSLTKCGCCSRQKKKLSPSSPKKKHNFSSRPRKCLARQEVQPPCFLLTRYAPRPWPTSIRKFRSNDTVQSGAIIYGSWFNLFCFLSGEQCSSICPEKNYRKFHSNGKRSMFQIDH